MNRQDRENLYRLFREHANNLGVNTCTIASLKAFIASVRELRCPRDQVMEHYRELVQLIRHTEPAVMPLIHLVKQFEEEVKAYADADEDEIRRQATRILGEKIVLMETKMGKVVEHGLTHVADGDGIIVLSPTTVVTAILVQSKTVLERSFHVIVLQQNVVRTRQLIDALSKAQIDHVVIPEYNLCHYLHSANKQFIGAVTVTSDRRLIAPPGTSNAAHLAHSRDIQIYLFANTLNYSRQPAERQRIYQADEDRDDCGIRYQMTVHSHDIVDLDLIDHIINEDGEMKNTADSRLTA